MVAAWQAGAISQDTMFDLFRKGEVLPEGRTNAEEEADLIAEGRNRTGPLRRRRRMANVGSSNRRSRRSGAREA